jgi:hypothetical protein
VGLLLMLAAITMFALRFDMPLLNMALLLPGH